MRNNILVGFAIGYAIALIVYHLNPLFVLFSIALLAAAAYDKVTSPVDAYVYDDAYLRDLINQQSEQLSELQSKIDALNIKSAFKPR